MSTMLASLDIGVFYPEGAPIAFVEVKNAQLMSAEFATWYRDNLLAHRALPWSPYFLIVSQELGFLWDQRPRGEFRQSAPVEFSMKPVVRRYASWLDEGEWLGEGSLTIVLIQWLYDLADRAIEFSNEPEATLATFGFIDEVRGAIIRTEADL